MLNTKVQFIHHIVSVYFPEGSKGGNGSGSEMSALNDVLLYSKRVNLANEIQVLKTKTLNVKSCNKIELKFQTIIRKKV